MPRLLAVSDLHVSYAENRRITEELKPVGPDDWLVVAGDVGEKVADIRAVLALLRERFATVIWVPGNHELWTMPDDPVRLRGVERYEHLVGICREIGVHTPEDEFPVFDDGGQRHTVAPLFLLYDYSFRMPGVTSKEESLRRAYEAGIVCTDERVLFPDPYPSREEWCAARVAESERRLAACDPALPTVLVNHHPLVRADTDILRFPEFAQWCGTTRSAGWHVRFRSSVVIYGHLHIPRTTWHDGVRFEEVSLGYPREWKRWGRRPLPQVIIDGE